MDEEDVQNQDEGEDMEEGHWDEPFMESELDEGYDSEPTTDEDLGNDMKEEDNAAWRLLYHEER